MEIVYFLNFFVHTQHVCTSVKNEEAHGKLDDDLKQSHLKWFSIHVSVITNCSTCSMICFTNYTIMLYNVQVQRLGA